MERDSILMSQTIFVDGKLVSGSLEALVELFLPCIDTAPDRLYTFTFLLTSRLFLAPADLLFELGQAQVTKLTENSQQRRQLLVNLVEILDQWTKLFPYDFMGSKMTEVLKLVCASVTHALPEMDTRLGDITGSLLARLTVANHAEQVIVNQSQSSRLLIQHLPSSVSGLQTLCPDPQDLARQLTIVELDRLRYLGPEELMQSFCQENPRKHPLLVEDKKVYFLEAYIQWFNRLSMLVASEICSQLKKKDRVSSINYFIDCALCCFHACNFNSLMAILAGLNLSPVSRLKKTWLKVTDDRLQNLEQHMSPAHNFGAYRRVISSATKAVPPIPVIPFFSLFLKDLYFLNEMTATRLTSGFINFEKCREVARMVAELMTWRTAAAEVMLLRVEKVIDYLTSAPMFGQAALAYASFECEAPEKDSSSEKSAYKQLKEKLSRGTAANTQNIMSTSMYASLQRKK